MENLGTLIILAGIIMFGLTLYGTIKPSFFKKKDGTIPGRISVLTAGFTASFVVFLIGGMIMPREKPNTQEATMPMAQIAPAPAQINDNAAPSTQAPSQPEAKKIDNNKSFDLEMTADAIAKAEKTNKARFIRDIVGRTVKLTGIVDTINDSAFHFKAKEALLGWPVYISDNEFLANLDKGKKVTVICRIEDTPLVGGSSRCE